MYIIFAILILLFMVLIHELGHYIFGTILGFKINEFAVGFGPAIFKKTRKNGQVISLRVLPLGGFCAFDGEDDNSTDPRAFNNMPAYKRLIVLFGGVFFNFLSAIIFSFILLVSVGYEIPAVKNSDNLSNIPAGSSIRYVAGEKIDFVYDNSYSKLVLNAIKNNNFEEVIIDGTNYAKISIEYKESGKLKDGFILYSEEVRINSISDYYAKLTNLRQNNIILSVNNQEITFENNFNKILTDYIENNEFTSEEIENMQSNVQITYLDNAGNEKTGVLPLLYDKNSEKFYLADKISVGVYYETDCSIGAYRFGFFEGLIESVPFTLRWAQKILIVLGGLFTGDVPLSSLGGTVTTITTIADYSSQDLTFILVLLPMIAINLAVFNILPIPALDGARMVFVLIEMIRRKPINKNVEGTIHAVGLILLFGFVIVIDILHFTIWT